MVNSSLRLINCCSILLLSSVALLACQAEKVPGGQIILRNDIRDKEYNTFVVDKIVTAKGRSSFRKKFMPGEELALPVKNVRKLRLSRRYADHYKVYVVSCPADLNQRITLKLIDVHTNRLQGGCALTRKGKRDLSGYMVWDD